MKDLASHSTSHRTEPLTVKDIECADDHADSADQRNHVAWSFLPACQWISTSVVEEAYHASGSTLFSAGEKYKQCKCPSTIAEVGGIRAYLYWATPRGHRCASP